MIEVARARIDELENPVSVRSRSLQAFAVPIALLILGGGSAWLYYWGRDLHRFTQWIAAYIGLFIGQLAFYSVASYIVVRWSSRSSHQAKLLTLGLLILFAIGFRALLVPQTPYLSQDVYRYVWDGEVQRAGINPYRYDPEADELRSLRDDSIFPNIAPDDKRWLSPYPPLAQFVFYAVAVIRPMNVTAFKAAMALLDLIAMLLLMIVLARSGLDPARAIFFAWHPLLIFEAAHSGHIESLFIAFIALAILAWSRHNDVFTGVALAGAALVKLYPALLLPAFLIALPDAPKVLDRAEKTAITPLRRLVHKRNVIVLAAFAATVSLAYLPYAGAGSNVFGFLRGYFQEEGFVQSGARYFLLDALREIVPIPTVVFLIFAGFCFVWVSVWCLFRPKREESDLARAALMLIGCYLLLTTPRYAWYYAWLIPFLCLVPRAGWWYLTCASALLYLVWYTPLVYPQIPLWLGAVIFVPTALWLVWEWLNKSRGDVFKRSEVGVPR
jgi:hypothetical protein